MLYGAWRLKADMEGKKRSVARKCHKWLEGKWKEWSEVVSFYKAWSISEPQPKVMIQNMHREAKANPKTLPGNLTNK